MHGFVDVLLFGNFSLPWWGYIIVALVLTHVTIASVTIYCHRAKVHRALDLHFLASHFFRFWLWLTTSIIPKEWAAVHRKHHQKVDSKDDPHSPHHQKVDSEDDPHSPRSSSIGNFLLNGWRIYAEAIKDQEMVNRLGYGMPNDWLERNVYSNKSSFCLIGINNWGLVIMLLCDLALFGLVGLLIWIVQMVWIPTFAAGVVNGLGHWSLKNWFKSESSLWYRIMNKVLLYRNTNTPDKSANIIPWGILIGGEELHNNHHAKASSARLSSRWYEIDIGWLYICILRLFFLAKVRTNK